MESDGDIENNEDSSGSSEEDQSNHQKSTKSGKNDADESANSSNESDEDEYRPTRSRAPYSYRKYKAKAGPHTCSKCGSKFRKKEILKNHMLVHSDLKPHKCPLCTAEFKRKGDYNRHMSMHERTKGKSHACPTCKLTFLRKNEYSRHVLTHAHLFPFKCKECKDAKMFTTNKALKKHMGRANSGATHCLSCLRDFKCRVAFKKHMDSHEAKLAKVCRQCGDKFDDDSLLEVHISSAHNTVRPFACAHCDRGFKTKFELVRHRVVHSVMKPFGCEVCAQNFRTKAQLKNHSMTHKDATANRSNVCQSQSDTSKSPKVSNGSSSSSSSSSGDSSDSASDTGSSYDSDSQQPDSKHRPDATTNGFGPSQMPPQSTHSGNYNAIYDGSKD